MKNLPSAVPTSQPHLAVLDGMRGVAALFVVFYHALSPFGQTGMIAHAYLAVDFFFLLSGFVIAYAYEHRLRTSMTWLQFLTLRLIRLYPLLLLGLIFGFTTFLFKVVFLEHTPLTFNAFLAFICGIFLIPSHLVLNEGWASFYPFNTPTWSLFFEFLVNLTYVLALPKLSGRVFKALLFVAAMAVLIQSYLVGSLSGGANWGDIYLGVTRVIYPFFAGIYLFRLNQSEQRSLHQAFALPLIALLLGLTFVCPVPSLFVWLFDASAVLFLFPLLVLSGSRLSPSKQVTALCLFLGELSYPLYILHYPVVRLFSRFARSTDVGSAAFYTIIFGEVLVQVLLALLALRYFDKPVRAWLMARYKKQPLHNK